MIKKLSVCVLLIFCIASCQNTNPVNNIVSNVNSSNISSKNIIKGIVQFSENKFKVKASVSEVSTESTISISYLPNTPILGSRVIASGLTDINGNFSVNTYSNFNPATGDIFVLEASKRIGGAGNELMSLRTFIKWDGSNWQSMTGSGIYINSYTTALAIISNYNQESITPTNTIGKISISGANISISNIGTTPNIITSDTVMSLAVMVTASIQENKDPFSAIISDGYSYHIDRTFEVGKLKQDSACTSCSFVGQALPDILANTNLTNANLSEQDLTYNNLTNTTLIGVTLTDSILSDMDLRVIHNKDLSGAVLNKSLIDGANLSGTSTASGVNLTNSDLTEADLSYGELQYTNLSGAHFNNANLSYADLTGATITAQTDFSGADMSFTTWTDGTVFGDNSICSAGSIGTCNIIEE